MTTPMAAPDLQPAAPGGDIIAAIATPPGQGGVGVVRCSGPGSLAILQRLFRPSSVSFQTFLPRHMHHGQVVDAAGHPLDECLAVFFPGPRSFTGEDVAEFHCHGGGAILRAVVEAILQTGLARPASPGEFSRRAFLNGKLDLAQAEAVAEAIAAPTAAAARLAQDRLSGALSLRINALRESLEELRRDCCLAVDFPEDEVECLPPEAFRAVVDETLSAIRELSSQHRRTRLWREGAVVVLAGRVNAGKSSLLNAFLGRQRAIVSDTPGTTRDYVEESLLLDGMALRLVDTAGLREEGEVILDGVEAQGIARSRELMDGADLVLLVVDAKHAAALAHGPEAALLERLGDKTITVLNKVDALDAMDGQAAAELPAKLCAELSPEFSEGVAVSAATGVGLDALTSAMARRLSAKALEPQPGALVPNLRQTQCLELAAQELALLLADHAAGMPCDVLTVRLETACSLLEEITGVITSDAILDQIFSSFCIGK